MALQLFTNNATGYLSTSINNIVTSIVLQAGQGAAFPSPTGSDYFLITLYDGVSTIEIVKCTARSTDTLTVVRAQEGTSAASFASGSICELRVTRDTLINFAQKTGYTFTDVNIGVATATSVNKLTLTAPATSATLTIADGKTLTASNTLTLAGTDSTVMTFPSTSATIARTDAANTFTGTQTLTLAMGGAISNSSNYAANFGSGTLTAGAGTFSGIVNASNPGEAIRITGVLGSAAYLKIDSTAQSGKVWRVGYSGGAGGSASTFDIYNQTDNINVGVFSSTGLAVTGAITETGAAWTAYTPTISADTGTWGALTVTVARYRILGKTMFISLHLSCSVSSGSPGEARISLPESRSGAGGCYLPAAGFSSSGAWGVTWARNSDGVGYLSFQKTDAGAWAGACGFMANLVVELS